MTETALVKNGLLLLDKPTGITSHDLVALARRVLGTKKVGHAGTLDPMATGLMLIGVGPSTRLLTYLVGLDKTYAATIRLGAETPTDDADSEPTAIAASEELAKINSDQIERSIETLTGEIQQVPSSVSAIKIGGKRAYARVRAGEEIELSARSVTVSRFQVLATRGSNFLDLDVEIDCSSGTYIRALARDLGRSLGVGGHLTALRRSRVGNFFVGEANQVVDRNFEPSLLSPAAVASRVMEVVNLDEKQSSDLRLGREVQLQESAYGDRDASQLAAIDPSGSLIGVVQLRAGKVKPLMNLATGSVNG